MTEYVWVRPLKAIEDAQWDAAHCDKPYEAIEALLRAAIISGAVRAMLNGEIVPVAHIGVLLDNYARSCPDQPPSTLPPDLSINLPDARATLSANGPAPRRKGRPRKKVLPTSPERRLANEMHKRISSGQARGMTQAINQLRAEGYELPSANSEEAQAKQLIRAYKRVYQ